MARSRFLAWPAADQDWALALELLEREEAAERCPQCGTREVDWKDPETGLVWAPPKLMVAESDCRGCSELAEARAMLSSDRRGSTRLRFTRFDLEAFLEEDELVDEGPASSPVTVAG